MARETRPVDSGSVVPVRKAASRMMAAAVEAFSENGFGGTSTRDISKRLGMSPAAIYPHFATKEELLFAISMDGHGRALAAVEVAVARAPAGEHADRLADVVSAFVRWQADNHALARVVQYEIKSLTEEHYGQVVALRRRTSAIIEAVVREGVETGEFGSIDPVDATLAITSLCVDICRWFPSAQHDDPDRLAAAYASLALRMVQ